MNVNDLARSNDKSVAMAREAVISLLHRGYIQPLGDVGAAQAMRDLECGDGDMMDFGLTETGSLFVSKMQETACLNVFGV